MIGTGRLAALAMLALLLAGAPARAQTKPYIGFAYPAGGRQGTTFAIKMGGQGLDGVHGVIVSGTGVTARVVEYHRKLGPQETQLLAEQVNELKRKPKEASLVKGEPLADRIKRRMDEYVQQPACASIASLVFLEAVVAPDAEPGAREIRLLTPGGASNPLVFHVGQLKEYARKPLLTRPFQVLGKEEQALRKRPADEAEVRIEVPCTVNGQIAPGEVNAYRFAARKGQRLVISVAARQLIPFLADAVPGWFQPVLAVTDAAGKELAYSDDFRFKPDPVVCFEVPKDGEYRFTLTDAIYRGREDFVYRVTVGELPFITGVFPLGGPAGSPPAFEMKGWNLEGAERVKPPAGAGARIVEVAARRDGILSNRVPFAMGTLPEGRDLEPNNALSTAQRVRLPVIVNGRIDAPKDEDVFRVEGRAGETFVAEVLARRLDSPLDSVLKVTDVAGKVLALNDDRADPAAGIHTHHADSIVTARLPADGVCFVHLADAARQGGEAYAYRLRLSMPQPDFELRAVPASITMRSRASASVTVYALRKDGFEGAIQVGLKDPPAGYSAVTVTLPAGQDMVKLPVKTSLQGGETPVSLVVEGRARIGDREVVHPAEPAEDRMQAFLWRHLVPAQDLKAMVFDPSRKPAPVRVPPAAPAVAARPEKAGADTSSGMEAMTAMAPMPSDGMQEMTGQAGMPATGAAKPDKEKPAAVKPAPATGSPPPAANPGTPAPAATRPDRPATATAAPAATGTPAKPGAPATAAAASAKEPEKPKFTKQQVEARLRQLRILYEDWLLTDAFYLRKVAECETVQ